MNNSPKISVIVPIYKAEKYLNRCIDSLLAQTFYDFELLLIDDGSPDNSGAICDAYAEQDSRVRVFHKENGGVSSARQYGLDNALGEYIIHADPDDWVEKGMLKALYDEAIETKADMIICDYYENNDYISQSISNLDYRVLFRDYLLGKYHGACWNKLVRSQIFRQYSIRFPEDIIRWEDLWVTCQVLNNPVKVSYLARAFYHYDTEINDNSIVRIVSKGGVESQISFCNYFLNRLDCSKYSHELYSIISSTKELMFVSELYSDNEIITFAKSYNKQYISKNNHLSLKLIPKWCLSQLLLGNVRRSHLFFNIYTTLLIPIFRQIKKLINYAKN